MVTEPARNSYRTPERWRSRPKFEADRGGKTAITVTFAPSTPSHQDSPTTAPVHTNGTNNRGVEGGPTAKRTETGCSCNSWCLVCLLRVCDSKRIVVF